MICREEAIVLKTRDYRETSKIAIFYTKNHGKISALFKGIRKDPKKFATTLDFLTLNEVIFYKKRLSELHLASQCDIKKTFDCLKSDLTKYAIASFCAELIDSITQIEDTHPELFNLLISLLCSLDNDSVSSALIYSFTIKALILSGFQPHLEGCVVCRSHIAKHASFSNRLGGLLCDRCLGHDDQREDIHAGTIATILFLQKKSWPDSLRLHLMPSVERQLNRIIFSFLNFNVERKMKSLKILEALVEKKK